MKLPKNFGGQGFGQVMGQMRDAMERAKTLEEDLANQRIPVDKGPVKGIFNGQGELLKLKIDASVVDPSDVEMLEDLVVGLVRDGFAQATAMRNAAVSSILPNVPDIPGLS